MHARRKPRNTKNIIIAILSLVVLVETFLLLYRQPQKITIIEARDAALQPNETPAAQPSQPVAGKIALVVDDFGYSTKLCTLLDDITAPLAVSILPDLRLSIQIAHRAQQSGKDVILHLPLEPYHAQEQYPDDYVIETSMRKEKIERIILKALASVPGAVGVNNHMGSKATEDWATMAVIFGVLKKHRLFFVDSLVTSESVCERLAGELRVPFAKRDVFLDNTNERAYIEGQFAELAHKAQKHGYALGVGHARQLTLQIIKEQISILQQRGFEFISLKDFIKAR